MSAITTHILDTVLGKPAAAIGVTLEKRTGDAWAIVNAGITDADGRCRDLASAAGEGVYRITFASAIYLEAQGRTTIYPEIAITFRCDGKSHYHLPVLLTENSYTTYRGS